MLMRIAAMMIHQGIITAITLSKETHAFTQSLTNHSSAIVYLKTKLNIWEHRPKCFRLAQRPCDCCVEKKGLLILYWITEATGWAVYVGISNLLKWAYQCVWYLALWGKIQICVILFVKYWISEIYYKYIFMQKRFK